MGSFRFWFDHVYTRVALTSPSNSVNPQHCKHTHSSLPTLLHSYTNSNHTHLENVRSPQVVHPRHAPYGPLRRFRLRRNLSGRQAPDCNDRLVLETRDKEALVDGEPCWQEGGSLKQFPTRQTEQ
ncbi:hypothetical protein BC936DRAFT_137488 [Jimgerdemannia flammicorona]|uniref:Uncharacterized protein n=1 Tax=Jimgerdemannia flammicorona TaxID=994334 RepID=A0A433CX81_9FUNG|nr:hypothetical protein BC936DRAFT_137488 [Jimgerdemannia flammicorona]